MYFPKAGLFEASGIGSYDKTGDWTWEYYPPPYDFLAPADSVAMPAPVLQGMGGCGCGGSCGGCGGRHEHKHGMGLFDSMDWTTWGAGEWTAIAVGAYVLMSLVGDTKRTAVRSRAAAKAFRSAKT